MLSAHCLPPGCPASPPATWVPCQPALLGQLLLIFQKAASVSPFLDISPRPPSLDAHRVFFLFHFIFKQTFLFKRFKKKGTICTHGKTSESRQDHIVKRESPRSASSCPISLPEATTVAATPTALASSRLHQAMYPVSLEAPEAVLIPCGIPTCLVQSRAARAIDIQGRVKGGTRAGGGPAVCLFHTAELHRLVEQ